MGQSMGIRLLRKGPPWGGARKSRTLLRVMLVRFWAAVEMWGGEGAELEGSRRFPHPPHWTLLSAAPPGI